MPTPNEGVGALRDPVWQLLVCSGSLSMQPMDKVVPPSALLGRAKLHLLWFVPEGDEDVVDQCDLEWS